VQLLERRKQALLAAPSLLLGAAVLLVLTH
jgi:hypothetical protein